MSSDHARFRENLPLPRRNCRFPKSSNDFSRPVLNCRLGKQKPEKSWGMQQIGQALCLSCRLALGHRCARRSVCSGWKIACRFEASVDATRVVSRVSMRASVTTPMNSCVPTGRASVWERPKPVGAELRAHNKTTGVTCANWRGD